MIPEKQNKTKQKENNNNKNIFKKTQELAIPRP